MKWEPCDCEDHRYHRVERSWWMRTLFGGRRLYLCTVCDRRLFLLPWDVPPSAGLAPTPHRVVNENPETLWPVNYLPAALDENEV